MEDQTSFITKPASDNKTNSLESSIGGVSIRGHMTLMVVFTVCLMSVMKITIIEPLYTMTAMIVAFYFGQNKQQQVIPPNTSSTTTTVASPVATIKTV